MFGVPYVDFRLPREERRREASESEKLFIVSHHPAIPRATMTNAENPSQPNPQPKPWTFLTNHARVLLLIASDPDTRLRSVAVNIGITERATQRIVADLEEAGYLSHEKVGRRNRYQIDASAHLRHPLERSIEIDKLIGLFVARAEGS